MVQLDFWWALIHFWVDWKNARFCSFFFHFIAWALPSILWWYSYLYCPTQYDCIDQTLNWGQNIKAHAYVCLGNRKVDSLQGGVHNLGWQDFGFCWPPTPCWHFVWYECWQKVDILRPPTYLPFLVNVVCERPQDKIQVKAWLMSRLKSTSLPAKKPIRSTGGPRIVRFLRTQGTVLLTKPYYLGTDLVLK